MARFTIKVPVLEGVDGVTVLEWHVAAGQQVDDEMPLVTLEADKVDVVVPSYGVGMVVEILADPDMELSIGDPLCVIETDVGKASP